MQRRYILGTAVLYGAACTPQVYTPASSAAFWASEPSPPQTVVLPDYSFAAATWQLPPENPWTPFAKQTLLAALKDMGSDVQPRPDGQPAGPPTAQLPDVSRLISVSNAFAAAARVAQSGIPDDAMWVVDLRGPASVAFGTALSQRTPVPLAVVPTFNNWPADGEIIPAEETLSAMVHMYPRKLLSEDTAARPVFLLDAWRLAFRTEEVDEESFDNRYYLNPADLPDIERLHAQGIQRVIYVVESLENVSTEEDDLHAVFMAYQQAGITIHMVDLALLAGYTQQTTWNDTLRLRLLNVAPRVTVLDDPDFFLRARGGFGGIYASPSYRRYGVSHRYGGHHHHGYGHSHGFSHGGFRGGGFGG